MKSLKMALVAAATAAVLAPAQAEGLSYSVGIFSANTSDSRGDDIRPSLELGASYELGNGFYAGAGYTTGKFGDQNKARGELVFDAGYGQELSSGISYDVNVSRTQYPTSGSDNYNELALTVGYGPFAVTYGKWFSSSSFDKESAYFDFAYSYALTEKVDSYVILTKSYKESSLGAEVGVSYDLGDNLSASAVYEKGATPKFVLGLTKSF